MAGIGRGRFLPKDMRIDEDFRMQGFVCWLLIKILDSAILVTFMLVHYFLKMNHVLVDVIGASTV